jgi:hypothetical protein
VIDVSDLISFQQDFEKLHKEPEVVYERKPCKDHYMLFENVETGEFRLIPATCGERFGRCCFEQRYNRSLERLECYKIKSTRLIHVSIGYPSKHVLPSKKNKHDMEKILTKFHKLVRRFYKWTSLRIFDMSQNCSFQHYHYALLPEQNQFDVRVLRKLIKKASNGKIKTVSVHGFRSKRCLFKYMAKRMSGFYGHEKKEFFLEDVMSYQLYHELFFNVRSLVVIASSRDELTCITAPDSFETVEQLPKNWIFTGITIRPRECKPPPSTMLKFEELKNWAESEGLFIPEFEGHIVYGFCELIAQSE